MDREKFRLVVHRGLEGAQTVLGCRKGHYAHPFRNRPEPNTQTIRLASVEQAHVPGPGQAVGREESELYMLRGCRQSRISYKGLAFGQR